MKKEYFKSRIKIIVFSIFLGITFGIILSFLISLDFTVSYDTLVATQIIIIGVTIINFYTLLSLYFSKIRNIYFYIEYLRRKFKTFNKESNSLILENINLNICKSQNQIENTWKNLEYYKFNLNKENKYIHIQQKKTYDSNIEEKDLLKKIEITQNYLSDVLINLEKHKKLISLTEDQCTVIKQEFSCLIEDHNKKNKETSIKLGIIFCLIGSVLGFILTKLF